jgi:UDP-N-acetylglucosamine diphosphorylase/glucosamine-1-phosphate N-acetyltransferase
VILTKKPLLPRKEGALVCDGVIVGMIKRTPPYPATAQSIVQTAKKMKHTCKVDGYVLNAPWDMIRYNAAVTALHAKTRTRHRRLPRSATVIGDRKYVYLGEGTVIHPEVVIDVSSGPVIIDTKAIIRPFTMLCGPSYIGPGTIVDRAKIVASSIGPMCRIGGEVEASIFQGFSNKYHEGFLGHSFVGEWVNLGALSTNSDLKNNYANIRVVLRRKTYDTGMIKLGCCIGDHTKTGIGTLIPTGAMIGSFVNFHGGGMMPRHVKDFTWLTSVKQEVYDLTKALETAQLVMRRRGRTMDSVYKKRIKDCFLCRDS